ncbi:MAG: hypothetical protein LM583_07565 [Desulfurococcaceae archaeon]|nr:hypothetical protein [Desulfurococcaceae archaeon]
MYQKILLLFSLIFIFIAYLFYLKLNSTAFIDPWPLHGFAIETILLITTAMIIVFKIFRRLIAILIFTLYYTFIVLFFPVFKYINIFYINGPWDSIAHYSFSLWILQYGKIDTLGYTYYAREYGHHPGNGLLPAMLSLVTHIRLDINMNFLIFISYSNYLIFIYILVINLLNKNLNFYGFKDYVVLIALITTLTYVNPYYTGFTLVFGVVGALLYIFFTIIIKHNDQYLSTNSKILFSILYCGLLLTHLSTAIITLAFIVITVLFNIIILRGTKLLPFIYLTTLIFLVYELFVDYALFGGTLVSAISRVLQAYVQEAQLVHFAVSYRQFSLVELLLFALSYYGKILLILFVLFLIFLYAFYRVLKEKHNYLLKLLTSAYVASLLTWIIGWAGVGSLLSGRRAVAVISFVGVVLLVYLIYSSKNTLFKLRNIKISLLFIVTFLVTFLSSFGLPLKLTIVSEEGEYSWPTLYQGGFSIYSSHSIIFLNSLESELPYLCLQPFTAFGLCDLLWHRPKIPKHGFISPEVTQPKEIIELVKRYANYGNDVIFPLPLGDVMPGPLGYKLLYLIPYSYLVNSSNSLIYNNGYYILFII